ncbi:hypothetical protein ACLQ28_04980 [Micromonospora sp. DT201]|uniref:hypothetical protein n=1 Tax=Micromonospora sp. DT201 TaxID=3393442 RepID=UPI003CFB2559
MSDPIVVIRLAYLARLPIGAAVVDLRSTDQFNETGPLWRRESRRNLADRRRGAGAEPTLPGHGKVPIRADPDGDLT